MVNTSSKSLTSFQSQVDQAWKDRQCSDPTSLCMYQNPGFHARAGASGSGIARQACTLATACLEGPGQQGHRSGTTAGSYSSLHQIPPILPTPLNILPPATDQIILLILEHAFALSWAGMPIPCMAESLIYSGKALLYKFITSNRIMRGSAF